MSPDELRFTMTELAEVLQPPIRERSLRQLITIPELHIRPVSYRRGYHGRRRAPAEYDYNDIADLCSALTPWLTRYRT